MVLRCPPEGESSLSGFFFFNDTATTEIYTLSLHDALPISPGRSSVAAEVTSLAEELRARTEPQPPPVGCYDRSEEHTSELQSRQYLVCRLLLEKKIKRRQPLWLLFIVRS